MSDEDYESVEHPRLELHLHVATKFVQVIMHDDDDMRMLMYVLVMILTGLI